MAEDAELRDAIIKEQGDLAQALCLCVKGREGWLDRVPVPFKPPVFAEPSVGVVAPALDTGDGAQPPRDSLLSR